MYDVNAMSNGVLSSAVRKAKDAGTPVFTNDNFNNGVLEVNDCEQLVYAFRKVANGFNTAHDITKIVLNPLEDNEPVDGFYFQNYEGLKEGLTAGFDFSIGADQGEHQVIIEPLNSATTVIIQGVQAQTYFIMCYEYSSGTYNWSARQATFNNVYFKDCVCTKTDGNAVIRVGFGDVNYGRDAYARLIFNNCELSMHIRQGENSPIFDNYVSEKWKTTWNKSSRYVEYSDLNPDNIPTYDIMFGAPTTECSTIIRNASLYCNDNDVVFNNSTNSSWDIEAYAFSNDGAYIQDIPIGTINNCFIRIAATGTYTNQREITFGTTSGVNIITTNLDRVASNNNVKQLSDSDCRNPQILNKWGFFVNTVDEE